MMKYGAFDTHCHLDAAEFDEDRDQVVRRAMASGVQGVLIPAVAVSNFSVVRDLAHQVPGGSYAIGIHPLYVRDSHLEDLQVMEAFLKAHCHDPRLVAVGEIGLDFFVPEIAQGVAREQQIHFYRQQLKLARQFDLPVVLHVRRSQDELLKWLRREGSLGGIAHAFNGSHQQAQQFIDQGFALGFGGAMTFSRALQIRRLATQLPLTHIVLETDSPDIAPSWFHTHHRNEPQQVVNMAQALALLRGGTREEILSATTATACRVIPKLQALWQVSA